ncbi:MAG: HEAT repeat domain-containing protein [Chloroflexi bacterium]|nr:HEAT repeat domain-containing protein [Chloroflexota bacterium]
MIMAVHSDLGLPVILVEELDNERVNAFARNYLGEEKKISFLNSLSLGKNRPRQSRTHNFARFASNPYLLAALIFIYINTPNRDLPRNNGALFHRLAMALWERERIRNTHQGIPFEEAARAFGKLAFTMLEANMPNSVSREYVLRFLAESILIAGKSANFIEIRGDEIRFYHQLLQEYFAAVHLAEVGIGNKLRPPKYSSRYTRIAQKWDQVIIALCGITAPDATITQIAKIDPDLAVTCLESGITVSQTAFSTLLNELQMTLRNKDSAARYSAAEALRRLEWSPKTSELKSWYAVAQQNWKHCIEIGQKCIPALVNALSDNDKVRLPVIRVLAAIRAKEVVPILIQLLQTGNKEVRLSSIRALRDLDEPSCVKALIEQLEVNDKDISAAAGKALARLGGVALPSLIQMLGEEDFRLRVAAAKILHRLGWQPTDSKSTVLYVAALEGWQLPRNMNVSNIAELIPYVCDSHQITRLFSIKALAQYHVVSSVNELHKALLHADKETRVAAVHALGTLHEATSIVHLVGALGDESTEVRAETQISLERYGDSAVYELERVLHTGEMDVAITAVSVLERIGTSSAIAALEKVLTSVNPKIASRLREL